MTPRGRPLRFLALALAGWTGLRVAMLWPASGGVAGVAPPVARVATPRAFLIATAPMPDAGAPQGSPPERASAMTLPRSPTIPSYRPAEAPLGRAVLSRPDEPPQHPTERLPKIITAIPPAIRQKARRSRWSGDAWLLVRGSRRAGSGFGAAQLGGSQAGARIAYALAPDARVALAGRVTAPLHGGGREAAVGLEWRLTRLPVRVVAEARAPLDGAGRMALAAGAVGGFGPQPIGAAFTVETYGQAGVVDRGRLEGFVEGTARLARPLAMIGRAELDFGGGLWGGAQPGAARLDLGPTLGLAVPIGAIATRLSLDWRARIAGDARPGSGFALTLGADL